MKTIVAVTFQNKKTIFNHTGKCRNYLIYTIKGNGAIDKLAKYGIACYKIEESDPDIAINKLINGTLEAMSPISN